MKTNVTTNLTSFLILLISFFILGCSQGNGNKNDINLTAADILGNPDYLAISYGGYRQKTRETVPTIEELKEDMKVLAAMGIKVLRTYNTQQFGQTANLLEAIKQLKEADSNFQMFVMLGVWIDCKNAWTDSTDHTIGHLENNTAEIKAAVKMVKAYPDIIKVIAVGNEAMVQWALTYFVTPNVTLKWVNHLKKLRESGEIPAGVWITSSDNYESWGGGAKGYQTDDLVALIKAVDYISLHTYPFHDSHYNPTFWGVSKDEENLSKIEQIDAAMLRAKDYAISQYQGTVDYLKELGIEKPIHIGETGWASISNPNSYYGSTGSRAADQYKNKLYYEHMRDWTNSVGMSCFYFEAFDEQWKDELDPLGSENHFGLINLKGEAKFALWELVDKGAFDGLTRNGSKITKTYNGNKSKLLADIFGPPLKSKMGMLEISTVNENRKIGDAVSENTYVVLHETLVPDEKNSVSYASEKMKLNIWESTCTVKMSQDGLIEATTGTGEWWGCAIELIEGVGENMSNFKSGRLNFDMKGNTASTFQLGFQTGIFAQETQVNNYVVFSPKSNYSITNEWKTYSIPISELDKGGNLNDVTAALFLRGARGDKSFDGKNIYIKNIYYSKK